MKQSGINVTYRFKLSYHNEYKSYLRPDEDVDTSKIRPAN